MRVWRGIPVPSGTPSLVALNCLWSVQDKYGAGEKIVVGRKRKASHSSFNLQGDCLLLQVGQSKARRGSLLIPGASTVTQRGGRSLPIQTVTTAGKNQEKRQVEARGEQAMQGQEWQAWARRLIGQEGGCGQFLMSRHSVLQSWPL